MDNILKPIVLKLNGSWSPIGHCSAKQAIISMCDDSSESGTFAMNIEYGLKDLTQDYDFDNPTAIYPVKWDEWVKLPIRDYDMVIRTSNSLIRLPTVVIAHNYHKMPMVKKSPTKMGIFERDNGICQYSGKKLSRAQANIDHLIPRDRYLEIKGHTEGMNDWENLVLSDRNINSKKGNKLNEEAGLKLIREPKAPAPQPVSASIKDIKHPEWRFFLHK